MENQTLLNECPDERSRLMHLINKLQITLRSNKPLHEVCDMLNNDCIELDSIQLGIVQKMIAKNRIL